MKAEKLLTILFIGIFLFVLQSSAQTKNNCSFPEFNSCIGLKPLILNKILGKVWTFTKDKQTGKEEFSPWGDLCVSLFTKDKKLIATTEADEKGNFRLKKVPDGEYYLVVRHSYNALTPASLEIVIDSKIDKNRKIKVLMTTPNIDSCSYGEIQ